MVDWPPAARCDGPRLAIERNMLGGRTPLLAIAAACILSSLACSGLVARQRPTSIAEAEEIVSGTGGRAVEVKVISQDGVETRRGVLSPLDARVFLVADPTTGQTDSVAFADTRAISFDDRRPGAVVGMVIGATAGGIVGYELGHALQGCGVLQSDENQPCQPVFPHAGRDLAWGGAILTAVLGALFGSTVTQHTTLIF